MDVADSHAIRCGLVRVAGAFYDASVRLCL